MYRLTIYDWNGNEINTIERSTMSELLDFGRRLRHDYGAHYRLEHEGGETPLVDTRQPK